MKNSAVITPNSRFSYHNEDNSHEISAGDRPNFFKPSSAQQIQNGYAPSSARIIPGQPRDDRGSLSPNIHAINQNTSPSQHQNRPASYK